MPASLLQRGGHTRIHTERLALMRIRRLGSALAAVAIVTVLAVAVPSTANAATALPPPVTPSPDIPSRVVQMTKVGGTWTDVKAYEMLRGMIDYATKPGTDLATIPKPVPAPKPITAAASFTRGAAGGPLVSGFLGGFAIGTAGLSLYGQITGDDPLEPLCGTPFEGPGQFLYLGMMPDCNPGPVPDPNPDVAAWGALSYKGWSWTPAERCAQSGVWYQTWLWTGTTTRSYSPPTGVGIYDANGTNLGRIGSAVLCDGWASGTGQPGSRTEVNPLPYELRSSSTGERLASMPKNSTDPRRTPRCRIDWEDGSTTVGTGSSYTETGGLPLSARGLGCEQAYVSKPGAGPGLLPSRIGVESEDEAGAITQIADQPVPDMAPDQRKALEPNISRGLVLEKVVNGVTDSCNTWAADCVKWWSDTQEGTQSQTEKGTYRCTFNSAEIALPECGIYRTTFDTQTDKPTITDPETGEAKPWPSDAPANSTDPGSMPTPGAQCMAEWASAPNPIDWVLHPLKCWTVWATVPRPEVVTQTQTRVTDAWKPTIVGQLPGIVSTAIVIPDGGSGCAGPLVSIPIDFAGANASYEGHPLSACEEPMSTLATWSRLIGSAVLIWFTGLGIIRRASAVVNAPGVGGGPA